MVGTGMKAKKQPYKIESDEFPYTFHALIGHSDVECKTSLFLGRIGIVYFCLLLCPIGSDNF